MNARRENRRRFLAAAYLLAGIGLACHTPPQRNLMQEAETLVLDAKFDEAIPVLKKKLLADPEDAGAHYYLARCFQFASKPWLAVAQGELETALHLFAKQAKKSPIARFSDAYFEMICHIDIGKIRLRQIMAVLDNGGALEDIQPLLASGREAAANARRIMPDANEVKELEANLAQTEKLAQALRPPPATPFYPGTAPMT